MKAQSQCVQTWSIFGWGGAEGWYWIKCWLSIVRSTCFSIRFSPPTESRRPLASFEWSRISSGESTFFSSVFPLFHVFLLVSKADFSLKKSWQGKICTEYGKTSPETSFFTWEKFPFIFHTSDPVFFSLACDLTWHCGVVENLKRFVGSIQLITAFPLSLIIPWLDITCMLFWSFLWLAFGFQLCILWENHRIINVVL